jgi:hypothetical protein
VLGRYAVSAPELQPRGVMASSSTRTEVGATREAIPYAISPMRRAPSESAATPDTATSTGGRRRALRAESGR